MILKIIIPLLAATLFLAGCSTPQSRAQRNPELMAELSTEERARIEAGEVELGDTREMVEVALGEPDRIYSERTAEGERLIWAYHRGGLSGLSMGVGTGVGIGSGGSVGGGVSVGTGRRVRAEERMRIVFAEDRVIAIERAE